MTISIRTLLRTRPVVVLNKIGRYRHGVPLGSVRPTHLPAQNLTSTYYSFGPLHASEFVHRWPHRCYYSTKIVFDRELSSRHGFDPAGLKFVHAARSGTRGVLDLSWSQSRRFLGLNVHRRPRGTHSSARTTIVSSVASPYRLVWVQDRFWPGTP